MRCLCYAKFLSSGAMAMWPGEFSTHLGSVWTCVEDSTKTGANISNLDSGRENPISKSIVFIADCKSIAQLTSDLEKMPGAGISNIEVFPIQE